MKILILALLISFNCFATEKYLFGADWHMFGPNALDGKIVQEFKNSPIKNKVSLSDNWDTKWTLKKEYKQERKEQKEFSDYCDKNKIIEVNDNHGDYKKEANRPDFVIKNGILFAHGQTFLWTKEKLDSKKISKNGVGKIKRNIYAIGVKSKPFGNLSKEEIASAVDYAKKNKAHTIVFAHTHIEKVFDQVVNGVRVINVPRGLTVIEL